MNRRGTQMRHHPHKQGSSLVNAAVLATMCTPRPKPARNHQKPRANATIARQESPCKSRQLKSESSPTENRGVPGSSPGLAIGSARIPYGCRTLVPGGMAEELVSPAHETVVVPPGRATVRFRAGNACKHDGCRRAGKPMSRIDRNGPSAFSGRFRVLSRSGAVRVPAIHPVS
jgi:hypothetical protein